MAYFTPEDMPDKTYYIFGTGGGEALAEEYNVELLGKIPITEAVRTASDEGLPAATKPDSPAGEAFGELAGHLTRQISIRNAYGMPQQVPQNS
jgi:ATP-binding protein involved in chromosome partitioning